MLTAPRMIHVNDDPKAPAATSKTRATDTTGNVGATIAARARVRRKVLLVDDDSDFLPLLRATLKRAQYDLLTATSGVDYGQGYAFGKPEPLDSVLTGLRAEFLHRAVR